MYLKKHIDCHVFFLTIFFIVLIVLTIELFNSFNYWTIVWTVKKNFLANIMKYFHLQMYFFTWAYTIAKRSILYEIFHEYTLIISRSHRCRLDIVKKISVVLTFFVFVYTRNSFKEEKSTAYAICVSIFIYVHEYTLMY